MDKEKPVVLGKTSYYYKIAVPVLMAAVLGLFIWLAFAINNPFVSLAFFSLCFFPGALLVIYLLLPLKAVLLDEKRGVVTLRGGRKFVFSALKRQEISLLDIKSVEGVAPSFTYVLLGWLLLDTQSHVEGFFIQTASGERIRLFTVGASEAVAKRLQEKVRQAKYNQFYKAPGEL